MFEVDAASLEPLMRRIESAGEMAESVVNGVLHEEAGPIIYRRINPLIHPSGRTFKGHRASAASSDWTHYDIGKNLAVTVRTKSRFNYLYFPDDGSNTRHHFGNQEFFRRGGEASVDEIVSRCMAAIDKELEG